MKANTEVTIQDLILNKPSATIKAVVYDWENDTASIEVIFQEQGSNFKHSRSFEMNTNGDKVSPDDIKLFIEDQLKDFE